MVANALILLAHGSSDPQWAEPFEAIAKEVRARLPGTPVLLAYLERMAPDLRAAATAAIAGGATEVVIVPLFLAQGGHVRGDLPRLVAEVRGTVPGIRAVLCPAAGEAHAVQAALAAYCVEQFTGRAEG